MDINEQLIRDEGNSLKPYLDCCGESWRDCVCDPDKKGNLTIGVGRNLDANGISAAEGSMLFQNDLKEHRDDVNFRLPWAGAQLDDARYYVLVNMCFAMGIGRLLGFKKMLAAAKSTDWQRAHDELLDSKFGRGRHKNRAERLAKQMLTGAWV